MINSNFLKFLNTDFDINLMKTIHLDDIDNFPCYFYVKDRKGTYISYNRRLLHDLGFCNQNDLLTSTDFDFCVPSTALELRMNDHNIMENGKQQIFIEPIRFLNDKSVTSISYKIPLQSKNKKIIGVIGLSLVNYEDDFISNNSSNNIIKYINLLKHTENSSSRKIIGLSDKENNILFLWAKGKSARQIGEILNRSHRTIEHHLENIKRKLNIHSKSELMEWIFEHMG